MVVAVQERAAFIQISVTHKTLIWKKVRFLVCFFFSFNLKSSFYRNLYFVLKIKTKYMPKLITVFAPYLLLLLMPLLLFLCFLVVPLYNL